MIETTIRRHVRSLLLATLLALAPAALAPTPATAAASDSSAPQDQETRKLAVQLVDRVMDVPTLIRGIVTTMRSGMLALLEQQGVPAAAGGPIYDQYLGPAFQAHSADFRDTIIGIVAQDFTAAELRATLENKQNADRRSAAAKVPKMQDDMRHAGEAWGRRVATEAYNDNKTAIDQLVARAKAGNKP